MMYLYALPFVYIFSFDMCWLPFVIVPVLWGLYAFLVLSKLVNYFTLTMHFISNLLLSRENGIINRWSFHLLKLLFYFMTNLVGCKLDLAKFSWYADSERISVRAKHWIVHFQCSPRCWQNNGEICFEAQIGIVYDLLILVFAIRISSLNYDDLSMAWAPFVWSVSV